MGIKSVQDSPQFRFRLWGFLGVVFRPVIYPSLFFFFAFGSRFFMVNRGQSTQLNIFVGFDFFFYRRVLSSDAIEADLAIFSKKKQLNINKYFLEQWSLSSVPHRPFLFYFCWIRQPPNRALRRNRLVSIFRIPAETTIKGQICLITILTRSPAGLLALGTTQTLSLKNRKMIV